MQSLSSSLNNCQNWPLHLEPFVLRILVVSKTSLNRRFCLFHLFVSISKQQQKRNEMFRLYPRKHYVFKTSIMCLTFWTNFCLINHELFHITCCLQKNCLILFCNTVHLCTSTTLQRRKRTKYKYLIFTSPISLIFLYTIFFMQFFHLYIN